MIPALIPWLIGAIFGAGGAYALLRQTRKALNGVSARQRRSQWNTMLAIMVIIEKREDRALLAQFWKE